MERGTVSDAVRERFYSHTAWGSFADRAPWMETPCLLWIAAKHERGYGRFRFNGRVRPAHRVAWELATGKPPPDGMMVLQRCHRSACVNDAHLYLGTQSKNMEERASHGMTIGRVPLTVEECYRLIRAAEERVQYGLQRIEYLRRRVKTLKGDKS